MAKKTKKEKGVVQGEWKLKHGIEILRENVYIGDVKLKDAPEEQLAIIWTEKVGSANFREAVRQEVVYRVSKYFYDGTKTIQDGLRVNTLNSKMKQAMGLGDAVL